MRRIPRKRQRGWIGAKTGEETSKKQTIFSRDERKRRMEGKETRGNGGGDCTGAKDGARVHGRGSDLLWGEGADFGERKGGRRRVNPWKESWRGKKKSRGGYCRTGAIRERTPDAGRQIGENIRGKREEDQCECRLAPSGEKASGRDLP